MEQNEFCQRVLALVRHATTEEKEAIRTELLEHMEDHAAALMELGRDEETARAMAAAAMGDPEEIGRELDKQYPLFWLALSRVSLTLIILILVTLILRLQLFPFPFDNLAARTREVPAPLDNLRGTYIYTVDLRADIGSDVLRVFGVGLEPSLDGKTGEVSLAMCCYDKSPFGRTSGNLIQHLTYEAAGEEVRFRSGGGGSNAAAAYWNAREITVSREAETIAVCYDRFGEKIRLEIPLNWEDAA